MQNPVEFIVRLADWERDSERLRSVRYAVFVVELGIPKPLEWDGLDSDARHLIAETRDGTPCGTLRLLADGRIGRMAVLRAHRGQGVGSALLEAALALARREGCGELHLHAQVTAIDFYRRHGFHSTGPVFTEAGIPHQAMRMAVQ